MKFTIDIDDPECMELIDQITRNQLKYTYDMLQGPQTIPIFSHEPKVEAKKVKKLLKAFRKVHNWYALPDEELL